MNSITEILNVHQGYLYGALIFVTIFLALIAITIYYLEKEHGKRTEERREEETERKDE